MGRTPFSSCSFILCLACLSTTLAQNSPQVTIYYQPGHTPGASQTTVAAADYTGAAAYNPTVLQPPDLPNPMPSLQFGIQLVNGGTPGTSIPQPGAFMGFSIEMSVANQVLGKNSSYIQVPFLNLMSNIVKRAGAVHVRVGGNTQEFAEMVDSLPNGRILQKELNNTSNPTQTPPLDYTPDLLYMMRNISDFLNVRWYLGIPFNDTNWRLQIAERGQEILGEYLIGLQTGNEPDLYVRHGHRNEGWGPNDFLSEMQSLVSAMQTSASNGSPYASTYQKLLIGPNVNTGDWTPEMVWDTGFVDTLNDNLAFLSVEHYPADNCAAQFNTGGQIVDPQAEFPYYLQHSAGQGLVAPYLNSTAYAQSKGKKLLMFETNTASCGGFAGISDSFGAALWGLDYGLQMAHSNFSGALFHIGGQNVFYNPFTPPPTNQSTFRQWTIGPIYYSAIVMAEALGAKGDARVLDLNVNDGNTYTPAYAIYENDNPVRVALFNYMNDPSGASNYIASIAIGGGNTGQSPSTPSSVKVKYLAAGSVSQKGNFTWAGQTWGDHFASDGRPMGEESVQTVNCDTGNNVCQVQVPAPGFALVFLSEDALSESENGGDDVKTFATSAVTRSINTATVDPQVLATSNGHKAGELKDRLGSTSKGSTGGVGERKVGKAWMMAVVLGIFGGLMMV
ncbi:hypothetical protein K435DRAFT_748884 [Dendrothele bispora CBS 962.96]|uniref:Beta-glucuronidase C-terminal domain-containing protein n=1 Tax=Dendrothele bispora (strain CBS 962.96) TaxID=1314807 RepID=A0A4S8MJL2_DENBC|nr:hypothetical protein K435DRAFT_748884 [Dendrothele bispora CBS 962.96]